MLGFTGDNPSAEEAYQHKGGHSLWSHYCLPRKIEPGRLYLGWCSACICVACAETGLLEMMIIGPHRIGYVAHGGSGPRTKLQRLDTDNTEFHGPALTMTFDRHL